MDTFRLALLLFAHACGAAGPLVAQIVATDAQTSRGSSRPRHFNGRTADIAFAANDGLSGVELWTFDGVAASRIANVAPDGIGAIRSSFPDEIVRRTPEGAELFFAATHPNHGRELHYYDGVTVQRFEVWPGPASADPRHVTRVGTEVFYSARDITGVRRLHRCDGVAVQQVAEANALRDPYAFAGAGPDLYFAAFGGVVTELWRWRGGAVTAVRTSTGASLQSPDEVCTVSGVGVYCSATVNGQRVLVRVAPDDSVALVALGGAPGVPDKITTDGTTVACTARIGAARQVVRVDSDNAMTASAFTSAAGATIDDLVGDAGEYWFTARAGTPLEVWYLPDGASSAQVASPAIHPDGLAFPRHGHARAGTLWVAADDGGVGVEPWLGQSASVSRLADVRVGVCSGFPAQFTHALGNHEVFAATGANGRELFWSDGATVHEFDLNTRPPGKVELHAEPRGGLPDALRFKFNSPPGSIDALAGGVIPTTLPLPIGVAVSGLLLLGPPAFTANLGVSPGPRTLDVPFGQSPAVAPPLPIMLQLFSLSPTFEIEVSDPVSVAWGRRNCGGAQARAVGSYDDETGEYKIRIERSVDLAGTKWIGSGRWVRDTGEVLFREARPIESGDVFYETGVIDLNLPVSPSDPLGDRLLYFFLPEPPTQRTMPAPSSDSLIWASYC